MEHQWSPDFIDCVCEYNAVLMRLRSRQCSYWRCKCKQQKSPWRGVVFRGAFCQKVPRTVWSESAFILFIYLSYCLYWRFSSISIHLFKKKTAAMVCAICVTVEEVPVSKKIENLWYTASNSVYWTTGEMLRINS